MIWLDTKEEVDFDWFMEVLRNNELQVVSREWSEEECEEVRRAIAENKRKEAPTTNRTALAV